MKCSGRIVVGALALVAGCALSALAHDTPKAAGAQEHSHPSTDHGAPTTQPVTTAPAVPTPTPTPAPTPTPTEGRDPIVLKSGLKYIDLKVGDGAEVLSGAQVEVHFTGWLEDGTVFDSSVATGRPRDVRTNAPRPYGAWAEGMTGMRVGGKRKLIVPAELGFGSRGNRRIPPDATLVFEIEILSLKEQGPVQTSLEGIEPNVTSTGLKYWDLRVGDGATPTQDQRINMRFWVWLPDGRLLGTSRPNTPAMPLSKVAVAGWREGVSTMKQGGRRRLDIPPELAFGEQGGRGVPPNAHIIMEVELDEVLVPISQTSVEGIEAVVTESGLKYWDIKVGEGATPGPTSTCVMHYTGWLADGTQFDSSVERDKPFSFNMSGGVIKAWLEAAATMKVGGKRRIEVPPSLGYGERGRPSIPPNSTLIFEMELIEVK